jgi:hypothetical protein
VQSPTITKHSDHRQTEEFKSDLYRKEILMSDLKNKDEIDFLDLE